jgi:hypothetical protein
MPAPYASSLSAQAHHLEILVLLEIGLSEKVLSESIFFRDPQEVYEMK